MNKSDNSRRDTIRGTVFAMIVMGLLLFVSLCSSKAQSTMIDARDSREYNITTIGVQIWMAENLDYYVDTYSYYYMNDSIYSHQYGRMYEWDVADTICPAEYHLPTDEDWQILESMLGMSDADTALIGYRESGSVGKDLKSDVYSQSWLYSGNGTDAVDFTALAAGFRKDGSYVSFGYNTAFWTSTEESSYEAYYRGLFYNKDGIQRDYIDKSRGFYVRCVKYTGD